MSDGVKDISICWTVYLL